MKIKILQQLEGAKEAEGLTVIIDVFRAFTVEPCLVDRGADTIIAVGGIETALSYRERIPGCVLVGERHGVRLPGFDLGNSPSCVMAGDFSGRTVIHSTSAGTQGIVNASGADEIITASLANASAVAEYIRKRNPGTVSLVCMGLDAEVPTDEDTLCAEYIKSILEGKPIEDIAERASCLRFTSGAKFFDPLQQEVFPQADFDICVKPDAFDFVLRAVKAENPDDGFYMIKTDV